MERRNTIQKELILNTVRRLQCHATADELYREVQKEHPSISRATVYRNLNILAADGKLRKIEIPGEADRFDHNCSAHYHVRCVRCGRVFDVEMDVLPGLTDRIRDTHGIEFLDYDIVFKGICPECKNTEDKE